MGADVSAGPYPHGIELAYSAAAALVVTMTSEWYDEKRDSAGETVEGSFQQNSISASAFRAANEEIPWTLEGYLQWERRKFPNIPRYGVSWNSVITRKIFDDAREFVRRCAQENWRASYSY